jgi:hypothetical protein
MKIWNSWSNYNGVSREPEQVVSPRGVAEISLLRALIKTLSQCMLCLAHGWCPYLPTYVGRWADYCNKEQTQANFEIIKWHFSLSDMLFNLFILFYFIFFLQKKRRENKKESGLYGMMLVYILQPTVIYFMKMGNVLLRVTIQKISLSQER